MSAKINQDRRGFLRDATQTLVAAGLTAIGGGEVVRYIGRYGDKRVAKIVLIGAMMAGIPTCYFCVKAFSETDLTEDLRKIDVPTLFIHGDDDQIVPFADSSKLASKIVKNAKLIVYHGAPHGLATTEKHRRNADLLAFIQESQNAWAGAN